MKQLTSGRSVLLANPVPWPNNAKCAVAFTWDMDADSILHLAHPETAGQLLSTQSSLRYGPEVSIPRLCRVYRELDMRQTFFVPGWCMERYPGAVEILLKHNHEIGHHGYIHENPNTLSREEEHHWLHIGLECFDKYVGVRPKGWRAPQNGFSKFSHELLVQAGFEYDSSLMGDDVPYVLESNAGKLIEIPMYVTADDWPHFMHCSDLKFEMPIAAPRYAKEVYLSDFDVMWQSGGLWVSVWHPFLSGRPARVLMMIEMIEYMLEKGGVWFATLGEINDHIKKCMAQGLWIPRVDRVPFDPKPISAVANLRRRSGRSSAGHGN